MSIRKKRIYRVSPIGTMTASPVIKIFFSSFFKNNYSPFFKMHE
jgi:hypothetical protein